MCISDNYYFRINWLIDWFMVNSVTPIDSSSVSVANRNSYLKVNDFVCFRTEINLNVVKRSVRIAQYTHFISQKKNCSYCIAK